MQLRITNFCVRGFYPAFLANASISPIAEPSAIPILVAPRIETHCFLPLPSARLSAPNLKKLSFNPGQEVSSNAGKLVQLSDLKFQTEDQVGRATLLASQLQVLPPPNPVGWFYEKACRIHWFMIHDQLIYQFFVFFLQDLFVMYHCIKPLKFQCHQDELANTTNLKRKWNWSW